MGWNSWDCFGTSVTEAEVLRNAAFMAEHLLPHGWNTIVVDVQWYEPTARAGGYNDGAPVVLDAWGRPLPAENRFPSAAGGAGFAPLARKIHDLGLRFGIHIMRGVPRRAVEARLPVLGTSVTAADIANRESVCEWNTDNFGIDHGQVGAQGYYDSLAELFVEWGVDYVKVDDMLGPFHDAEVRAFSRAIRGADREIVLSMSPGQMLSTEHADDLLRYSDVWRVSADLWDRWADLRAQFDRLAMWAPFTGNGHWADADMLPLGRIGIRAEEGPDRQSRLTADEAQTMITLWAMARSPLMFGGNLPDTSAETLRLLTNDAVLEVLNRSHNNRQVMRHENLIVWSADAPDGRAYAALFNTGDVELAMSVPLTSVVRSLTGIATDLWSGAPTGTVSSLEVTLAPHASALFAVEPSPHLR
jgi:hypothetical protein